jgi:competence protein ComEC
MTKDRTLGQRAPLLWLLLPYIAGLAVDGGGCSVPLAALLALAAAAAAWAVLAAWRDRRSWAPALLVAMAAAGAASHALHRQPPPDGAGWPPREARLCLRIVRVNHPAPQGRTVSGMADVIAAEPPLRALAGQRIYLSLVPPRGAAPPERSEVLSAVGLLESVSARAPPGSLDQGLAAAGLHFRFRAGRRVRVLEPPSAYRRFCARTAARMNQLLGRGLERQPALAAVYRAMMLGQKHDLTTSQERRFLLTGTMHLFAINGVHIGVVALSLHALLALARCPRSAGAPLVLALLWLDVDSTGASPSAVRAFLMVAAGEVAWVAWRPSNPLAALSGAALFTLLADPREIHTASFQMSYGVMTALGALGFPLAARLQARFPPYRHVPAVARDRFQRLRASLQIHLLSALGVGAAAALAGAVTGIAFFGLLVPVGIVANLALLPLASLVIAAGVAALVGGCAHAAPAVLLFNRSAGVLLRAITALVALGARLPGGSLPAHYRAAWIGPAALGAFVAACLAGYAGGWRGDRGGFWPPFVIVAIVLLLGVSYRP